MTQVEEVSRERLTFEHDKLKESMDSIVRLITNTLTGEKNKKIAKTALKTHFQQFKKLFSRHTSVEETTIYPLLKKDPKLRLGILKAYQAHRLAKIGILELRLTPYEKETWGPKFLVVRDSILAHISEEETMIFPTIFP